MKAVILAGGFGTRLKDVINDVPKPMAPVLGKPFLEHQIAYLRENGITEIVLAVHHMSNKIKSYFGNGLQWGVDIIYSDEEVPMGTAGAIKKAQKYIDESFIVMNGDSYCDIDLQEMLKYHRSGNNLFTLSLKKSGDAINFGSVLLEGNHIIDFAEKKENQEAIVSTGVYLLEPKIFEYIEDSKNTSLEKDIFPMLAKQRLLHGYLHDRYFMDIGRPETYQKFKEDVLASLFISKNHLLSDAMKKMGKIGIDMLAVVDENRRLLGVVTERIIHRALLKGGGIDQKIESVMIRDPVVAKVNDDETKIQEILLSGVNRLPIVDDNKILHRIEFRAEKIRTDPFPTIRGRVPLRISFAGGGTDMPYFFDKHGGSVINATIDKYCHASIVKRADSKIIVNSDIYGELIFDSRKELGYDGKLDVVKAVINIMKPGSGFELYLYNDVPPGRGLGSSASLAVLIASLLSDIQEKYYDDYKIAEIAYKAEREELKIKGGWQDQYAAVTGGFSFMEFNADKNVIYPLRLKNETVNELNACLTLCYTGKSHFSGELQDKLKENFSANESQMIEYLTEMKNMTIKIKNALLTNDLASIGVILNESWEKKKRTNPSATNPVIDSLYEVGMKNGAVGGRLLGAGGGGYILFFHPPYKRNTLKKALEAKGGEIIHFLFEFDGITHYPVKSKF